MHKIKSEGGVEREPKCSSIKWRGKKKRSRGGWNYRTRSCMWKILFMHVTSLSCYPSAWSNFQLPPPPLTCFPCAPSMPFSFSWLSGYIPLLSFWRWCAPLYCQVLDALRIKCFHLPLRPSWFHLPHVTSLGFFLQRKHLTVTCHSYTPLSYTPCQSKALNWLFELQFEIE